MALNDLQTVSRHTRQLLKIIRGIQIDGRDPMPAQYAIFPSSEDGAPLYVKIPTEALSRYPRFRMNPVPEYLLHAEAIFEMTGEDLERAKAEACTLGLVDAICGERYWVGSYRRTDGKAVVVQETAPRTLKVEVDGVPVSLFRVGKSLPAFCLTATGLRLITEDEATWPLYPWGDSPERLPRDPAFIAIIQTHIPNWDGNNWSIVRERLLDRGRPESWFASASLLDVQMAFEPTGSTTETVTAKTVMVRLARPAGLRLGAGLSEGQPSIEVTAPKTGRTAGDASEKANLRDCHATVLEALKKLNATGRDNRQPAREVAKAAVGEEDGNKVKEPLADLARWGYVQSMQGRNGGSWITKGGKAALKAYRAAGKE